MRRSQSSFSNSFVGVITLSLLPHLSLELEQEFRPVWAVIDESICRSRFKSSLSCCFCAHSGENPVGSIALVNYGTGACRPVWCRDLFGTYAP